MGGGHLSQRGADVPQQRLAGRHRRGQAGRRRVAFRGQYGQRLQEAQPVSGRGRIGSRRVQTSFCTASEASSEGRLSTSSAMFCAVCVMSVAKCVLLSCAATAT